jgi:uncharacterized protein DUF1302
MRERALGAVLALTIAASASAQELRATGYAETDQIGYFETRGDAGHWGRNELLTQIDGVAGFGRPLRLFGSVELRADFADHNRDRVFVEEAYADFRYKSLDLRVGRQIVAWGKTDVVNPTDNLSPRDFTDPLESDDERLAVWGVRPRLQLGDVLWEGAVVPVFTSSILPFESPRWSPPFPPQIPNPFNPAQSIALTYEVLPTREPATTPGNMQYAAKVSGSARGWDLSASYFHGWEDVPHTSRELEIGGPGTGAVRITPENLKKQAVGGDFATVLGSFTVRGEAAYVDPDPLNGPNHVQYVLGVERTMGDMMAAGGTFLLVQWIHTVLPDDFNPAPLDFNYIFQKSTTVRVQRNLSATAQVVVEGLYEWATEGYYVQPSASYRFGDHVRVEGFVDVLGGEPTSFFGVYEQNKRVQFRVRYSF